MAGTLFLSDGCLKALLQRGTTDLKMQSLNLDLDVPREPIWVAAHYMKKSLRLQRPSLYSRITVHFHRSLSDCTWALQKIMRLINEGISFAFLQRGMKNAAMFVSITGDVHIAENWAEVNPFAVERKPWMSTIGFDFIKGVSTVVLRVKTHFRKATTLQKIHNISVDKGRACRELWFVIGQNPRPWRQFNLIPCLCGWPAILSSVLAQTSNFWVWVVQMFLYDLSVFFIVDILIE